MVVRTQRQFNLLRALVLLSDVQLEEEIRKNWDKIFKYFFPKSKEFEKIEDLVKGRTIEDFLFENYWRYYYAYLIPYVVTFVNNYYEDSYHYSFSSFEHNLDIFIKKFIHTLSDCAVSLVRKEQVELKEVLKNNGENAPEDERVMKTIEVEKRDDETEEYTKETKRVYAKIGLYWECEPDACDKCREHQGEELDEPLINSPHPNCRCSVKRVIYWVTEDGDTVDVDIEIL